MAPPLHPQVIRLLELMAKAGDPAVWEDTPDNTRARRRARVKPPTIELPIVRDVDADGVPCRLYQPSTGALVGLVVYFHGGGWVGHFGVDLAGRHVTLIGLDEFR